MSPCQAPFLRPGVRDAQGRAHLQEGRQDPAVVDWSMRNAPAPGNPRPRCPVLRILIEAAGGWQEFFLEGAGAWVRAVTHLKGEMWGTRLGKFCVGSGRCRSRDQFPLALPTRRDDAPSPADHRLLQGRLPGPILLDRGRLPAN